MKNSMYVQKLECRMRNSIIHTCTFVQELDIILQSFLDQQESVYDPSGLIIINCFLKVSFRSYFSWTVIIMLHTFVLTISSGADVRWCFLALHLRMDLRSNVKGDPNSMLETETNCRQLISSKRLINEINWLYMSICFWRLPCYLAFHLLNYLHICFYSVYSLRKIMIRHSTEMNAHFSFTKSNMDLWIYQQIASSFYRSLHTQRMFIYR